MSPAPFNSWILQVPPPEYAAHAAPRRPARGYSTAVNVPAELIVRCGATFATSAGRFPRDASVIDQVPTKSSGFGTLQPTVPQRRTNPTARLSMDANERISPRLPPDLSPGLLSSGHKGPTAV